jgi:ligand-binding sensor protein
MKLTDLMSVEKWVALQEELHDRFALNADIMDKDGKRLAGNTWSNELCRAIRDDAKGFGAICAPSGQMFKQVMQTGKKPFAEECDGGMLRISVPIIYEGELVGAVGGCGLVPDDGEIEEFMIEMSTDMSSEEIAKLSAEVGVVSETQVQEIQDFIKGKIAEAIGELK